MEHLKSVPFSKVKGIFLSKVSKVEYSNFYHTYLKIRMKALEDYMSSNGYSKYNQSIGNKFYNYYSNKRKMSASTKKSLKSFIEKVNDVLFQRDFVAHHTNSGISVSKHFNNVLKNYILFCKNQNNKESTLKIKKRICLNFLFYLDGKEVSNICKLTHSIIIQYCNNTASNDWRFIKDFILFLENNKYLTKKLSFCIPAKNKQTIIPSIYSNKEIEDIENSIDRSTATGKRNYCMILLASRYGMRASDIVNLTFNNIDYANNRIQYLQEKNGKSISFPLLDEIKECLQVYVEQVRPTSKYDNVFISLYGPHKPLNPSAVRRITTACINNTSIKINGRHHGSHIFRTHLATSMINDGVSYDVVKSVLGHSNYNTINHYAVLDAKKLRLCSLVSPPSTGYLSKIIKGEEVL